MQKIIEDISESLWNADRAGAGHAQRQHTARALRMLIAEYAEQLSECGWNAKDTFNLIKAELDGCAVEFSHDNNDSSLGVCKAEQHWDEATGIRLTDCCGAYAEYYDFELCCKECYEPVPHGQGDGNCKKRVATK